MRYTGEYIKRIVHILKHKEWYEIENRCFFWINGQYAYGLLSNHSKTDLKYLKVFYNRILFLFRIGLVSFDKPDTLIHAYVILNLYYIYNQKKYIILVEAAKNYIKREYQNNSFIRYRATSRKLFIDTIGMINSFCYTYGKIFNDREITRIADAHLDFLEKKCNEGNITLPYHVYDMESGLPFGSNSWGRGSGWYLLGLTEGAIYNSNKYKKIYEKTINCIYRYQNNEGFLYDDFKVRNHIDTSITSMAALALAKGIKYGLLDRNDKSWRRRLNLSINALLKSINEKGQVLNSSGECKGEGVYSLEFGNYFAQGYTLALLNLDY